LTHAGKGPGGALERRLTNLTRAHLDPFSPAMARQILHGSLGAILSASSAAASRLTVDKARLGLGLAEVRKEFCELRANRFKRKPLSCARLRLQHDRVAQIGTFQ
jgi:hypothetical protein